MSTDTQEDFTFPATAADSPPCFMESPPLWGPVSSSTYNRVKVEDGGKFTLCSSQGFKTRNAEEKMDKMWEYQNEEISRPCMNRAEDGNDSSPAKGMQISCVKAFKFSRANRQAVLCGNKASILVFIRVLKKVFAMHNSPIAIKKPEL